MTTLDIFGRWQTTAKSSHQYTARISNSYAAWIQWCSVCIMHFLFLWNKCCRMRTAGWAHRYQWLYKQTQCLSPHRPPSPLFSICTVKGHSSFSGTALEHRKVIDSCVFQQVPWHFEGCAQENICGSPSVSRLILSVLSVFKWQWPQPGPLLPQFIMQLLCSQLRCFRSQYITVVHVILIALLCKQLHLLFSTSLLCLSSYFPVFFCLLSLTHAATSHCHIVKQLH